METYSITLNGDTASHPSYESASTAWGRISQAVEDGRSIVAELWRHTRHNWDEDFYQGLLNFDGTIPNGLIVVRGQCIISRQCIAALTYP
jgi:hypothetical protein